MNIGLKTLKINNYLRFYLYVKKNLLDIGAISNNPYEILEYWENKNTISAK